MFTSLLIAALISVSDPLVVLDAERAALRSLSFTAQIETPKPNGRKGRFSMAFEFLAPNKYRSEIKMGIEGNLITVADGRTIWSHETRRGIVYKQAQARATSRLRSMGPVDPITAIATPTLPLGEMFTLKSAEGSILELIPKKAVANYDRVLLTTSPDGKTPLAAEAFKRGKSVAKITFQTFRRNAHVAASRFTFTPPAGARVETL